MRFLRWKRRGPLSSALPPHAAPARLLPAPLLPQPLTAAFRPPSASAPGPAAHASRSPGLRRGSAARSSRAERSAEGPPAPPPLLLGLPPRRRRRRRPQVSAEPAGRAGPGRGRRKAGREPWRRGAAGPGLGGRRKAGGPAASARPVAPLGPFRARTPGEAAPRGAPRAAASSRRPRGADGFSSAGSERRLLRRREAVRAGRGERGAAGAPSLQVPQAGQDVGMAALSCAGPPETSISQRWFCELPQPQSGLCRLLWPLCIRATRRGETAASCGLDRTSRKTFRKGL